MSGEAEQSGALSPLLGKYPIKIKMCLHFFVNERRSQLAGDISRSTGSRPSALLPKAVILISPLNLRFFATSIGFNYQRRCQDYTD